MIRKTTSLFLVFILMTPVVLAEDCPQNLSASLPTVKVPDIGLNVEPNTYFCFDENSIKDQEAMDKFKKLKEKNVFYPNNCLKEELFDNETDQQIADLILTTTKSNLKVYTTDESMSSTATGRAIVMTNSENKEFIKMAIKDSVLSDNDLTAKDKLEISAAAISSSFIGSIVVRNSSAFKNPNGSVQHDKVLHSNVGVLLNLGGVTGAYLAIETAGLGDKLGLSKTQKKWAILLAGSLLGILAGYGKERLYDYNHRDKHTYDPSLKGDLGATMLGGGALNVITGPIIFQF